jgi:hypothetical protein
MALALSPWIAWPLAVLACWVLVALVMAHGVRRSRALGEVRAPECFRSTAWPPPGPTEVRITFLGDLQRGVADAARPLARVLEEKGSHLLVSSGDFAAHGEAPFYGIALDAFAGAGIRTPTRVVPGNHDLFPRRHRDPTIGRAVFEQRLGPRWWSLRTGPVLVVGLDDALGPLDAEQDAWLRGVLAAHPGTPWVVVCHRPPRRLDLPGTPPDGDLKGLVALFEARPPLLVVSGHLHRYAEAVVAGVPYVVNAHGGDVQGFGLGRGEFELLHLRVAPDGSVAREVTRHRRRPWGRVLVNQLWVRCWARRSRGLGAVLAFPAAWLGDGFRSRRG